MLRERSSIIIGGRENSILRSVTTRPTKLVIVVDGKVNVLFNVFPFFGHCELRVVKDQEVGELPVVEEKL